MVNKMRILENACKKVGILPLNLKEYGELPHFLRVGVTKITNFSVENLRIVRIN